MKQPVRRKAARRKKSLIQSTVEEAAEANLGLRQRTDFSDLAGRWTPGPAFDEIIVAERQIDWDKWK